MATLKEWRLSQKLTTYQAADIIGIEQSHFNRLENNVRVITPHAAVLIEKRTNRAVTRRELRPDIFYE